MISRRFRAVTMLGGCLIVSCLVAGVAVAPGADTPFSTEDIPTIHPNIADDSAPVVLTSASSPIRFKASAAADTFCLYGCDITDVCGDQGRFQESNGVVPSGLGHDQGCDSQYPPSPPCWLGVDLTDQPTYSQIVPNPGCTDPEIQQCAESLNAHGPGNHALYFGRCSNQEPSWASAPGYGNNWSALLEWRATLVNPSVPQTVVLNFAFHHDTEPGYDFFNVEYDSANGNTVVVYSVDGSDDPFAPPGKQYGAQGAAPIHYEANGYAGPENNEIVIRLTAVTDGAWSDEDGYWNTICGPAMVDDIAVTYSEGTTFEDFEGGFVSWHPVKPGFAGDFSLVHPRLFDPDPCQDNSSPVVAFIDIGQCPVNSDNNCASPSCRTTGGSMSPNYTYGVEGAYVFNFSGGLDHIPVRNEVWSPPIAWDLPETDDDAVEIAGAFLRFTVWRHLPLENGIFYVWHVRSSADGGVTWTNFRDRNLVYYGRRAAWLNQQKYVTDLIQPTGSNPTHVQIALGGHDLADLFGFPGNDATPSPVFDNVSFHKFRMAGASITTRQIDMFMDAFPQSGEHDFTTLTGRQNADCRIDMRDVSSGSLNTPGDSMVVDVATIPGASLVRLQLCWIMDVNPKFDDVRVRPSGVTVSTGTAPSGWDQWSACVDADTCKSSGVRVPGRFFFDLPDENFAHPGDVIRYYVEAEDSGGRVTTLPADLRGFTAGRFPSSEGTFGAGLYAPEFTINFLPSAIDDGGGGWTQPTMLVWNDFGFRGGVNEYYQAFEQNGWRRGQDWDMFTTWGPSSCVSNGLGSPGTHGATPDQMQGYEIIFYFAGDLADCLLSDGTDNGANDKGNDIGTLTGWYNLPGDRSLVHFGDNSSSASLRSSPGAGGTYVTTIMGVDVNGETADLQDQSSPLVEPVHPCFTTRYVVYGGCRMTGTFDDIAPIAGASTSHVFLDPQGNPYQDGRAASVFYQATQGADLKTSLTFPYGFVRVWNGIGVPPQDDLQSTRSELLAEIVECLHGPQGGSRTAVADRPFRGFRDRRTYPNPFNPAVIIAFTLGQRAHVTIEIFNLRGERVATAHDGILEAGKREVVWRGCDQRGRPVASGVYFGRIQAFDQSETFKIALVR